MGNTDYNETDNFRKGRKNDPIRKFKELKPGTADDKFAGMINDTIWKYNPNSEYNKLNSKDGSKAQD